MVGVSSVAIQGLLPEELAAELGCKPSEVRRVVAAVHQHRSADLSTPMNQVSKQTRERITRHCHIGRLEIAQVQDSNLDPFTKFALRTHDGHLIETVRIPLEKPGRYSVCVSSQVGCGIGCRFCKTAQAGLARNLKAWEIVEQVRIVRQSLPPGSRVTGVVFQGMGEPLANVEAVIQAVRILSEPTCQSIDQKAITLCTSGLGHGIRRVQAANLRVRIGLSIGSAIPERRARMIPLENHAPLRDAVDALIEYSRKAAQSQMLAYTLLSGVNCSQADAEALRELALEIGRRSGRMPRLSLIAYNPIGPGDPFRRASDAEAEEFRLQLTSAGFPVVRRYSGGADINAACGQLAAQTPA
jgi:23S rRNA (adenine2503-C2)-methyltransferase